jgi:hypothetical protein
MIYIYIWIRGNLIPRKIHFISPGEQVKLRLSIYKVCFPGDEISSNPNIYIYIYIYIRVIKSEEINIEEILIDDFSKNIEY